MKTRKEKRDPEVPEATEALEVAEEDEADEEEAEEDVAVEDVDEETLLPLSLKVIELLRSQTPVRAEEDVDVVAEEAEAPRERPEKSLIGTRAENNALTTTETLVRRMVPGDPEAAEVEEATEDRVPSEAATEADSNPSEAAREDPRLLSRSDWLKNPPY
jgi:hypothetical protein